MIEDRSENQGRRKTDRVGLGELIVTIAVLLVTIGISWGLMSATIDRQTARIVKLEAAQTDAKQDHDAITRLSVSMASIQSDVTEIKADVKAILRDRVADSSGHQKQIAKQFMGLREMKEAGND